MSTPSPTRHDNIADVMKQMGQAGVSMPDLSETIKQVESVKTVKFAFHPWYPHPNFGSDGFRFNIPYPVLNRLELIPLAVFQYPRIIPKAVGQFAFAMATLAEAVPSVGSQPNIRTEMQMPSVSMRELHVAYGKFGMVELASLAAGNESELAQSFILFNAVMSEAQAGDLIDAGRRPPGLVLEDFPAWLKEDAPRALRASLKSVTVNGRGYKISQNQIPPGEKLIEEIRQSVALAEEAALNPSDGILQRTKELLNITANKGQGGKTHKDHLDDWLLIQYPSFKMDTDAERASLALQEAMAAGHQGDSEFKTGIMAILQQQQKTLDLLAGKVMTEPKAKGKPPAEDAL